MRPSLTREYVRNEVHQTMRLQPPREVIGSLLGGVLGLALGWGASTLETYLGIDKAWTAATFGVAVVTGGSAGGYIGHLINRRIARQEVATQGSYDIEQIRQLDKPLKQ